MNSIPWKPENHLWYIFYDPPNSTPKLVGQVNTSRWSPFRAKAVRARWSVQPVHWESRFSKRHNKKSRMATNSPKNSRELFAVVVRKNGTETSPYLLPLGICQVVVGLPNVGKPLKHGELWDADGFRKKKSFFWYFLKGKPNPIFWCKTAGISIKSSKTMVFVQPWVTWLHDFGPYDPFLFFQKQSFMSHFHLASSSGDSFGQKWVQ